MSSDQQQLPKPRRSRKSIAVMPTSSAATPQINKNPFSSTEPTAKPTRKSRSKSLGPGGLDALNGTSNGRGLKDANGNGRRVSSIVPQVQVKSILKPTLPLSPIQAIPAHRSRGGNKQSASLSQSSSSQSSSASALLNFQPPPFPSNAVPTTVPVRTEEEQQKRAEILAARAARRQSLGNRRVSFAPEATLHTWDVVEYYRGDDGSSTPSSTGGSKASTPATASTDRTGDFGGGQATPTPAAAPDPRLPETPPSVHNKGNNLSAPTPPMNFNNPDDDFSSPFSSGTEGAQSPFAGMPEAEDSSDDDSLDDFGDDTAGGRTFVSAAGDTTAGDMSTDMEIADDEVTGAFKAFGKRTAWKLEGATETDEQSNRSEKDDETENLGDDMTMEMTRPVGGLLPSVPQLTTRPGSEDDDGEMTMDITRPVGGLLASSNKHTTTTNEEDMTADMDITRPVGGILGNAAKALERAKHRSLGSQPQPLVQYDDETEEDEDMDMDMTRPVGGILSNGPSKRTPTFEAEDQTMDMDFTRPVGGILSNAPVNRSPIFADEDQTMDMDVTRPIGGILSKASTQTSPAVDMEDQTMDITRSLGGIISAPQPRAPSPTSSDFEENEEMTMEFTSVLGSIIGTNKSNDSENVEPRRGGLLSGDEWNKDQERLASLAEEDEGESVMDMTVAIGGILPSATEVNRQAAKESASLYPKLPALQGTQDADDTEEEDDDVDMEGVTTDITTAIASIMPGSRPSSASKDKLGTPQPTIKEAVPTPVAPSIAELQKEMETVTDQGSPTPAKRTSKRLSAVSAPGSEKRVTRRSSAAARKSTESAHPQSPVPAPAPVAPQPETPQQKQETPNATPKATPKSTPVTKVTPAAKTPSITKSTPVKDPTILTVEKRKEDFIFATPQKKLSTPQPCTPPDQLTPAVPATKPRTPSKKAPITETPLRTGGISEGYSMSAKKRIGFPTSPSPMKQKTLAKHATPIAFGSPMVTRGVGIDKPGLGSPRIAAKLSGRKSIGEEMPSFSPITVPRDLIKAAREDDLADAEEERREKEREAERRKSLDLRSRIDMLTPRKASRKSLAYGALLAGAGKRERSDDASAVLGGGKRRKSADGPIAVGDNYGSTTPQPKTPIIERPTLPTPGSGRKQTPRKRTVVIAPATPVIIEPANPTPVQSEKQFPEEEMSDQIFEEPEEEEPKISLQEFLNMTSITFLDGLTTTKRRQTGFPGLKKGRRSMDDEAEASLADCVIAGACTVPMLDLFQHSCRELKKYIREGREVVKTIEGDTLEENPLLFREYMEAPPDVKLIMDTQFKNVKTHARFLAKGIWYEWRMKLLEGVRAALEDNLKGLKDDETLLSEALAAGQKLLPEIISRFEAAKSRLDSMLEMKRRIEADDKAQLAIARENLQSVQSQIEQTKAKLAQRKKDLEKLDAQLSERELRKQTLQSCIEAAERVKEMNRGWSEEEVSTWKSKVTALEQKHGWTIISAVNGTMEFLFLKQLRILWDSRARAVTEVKYVLPAISKPSDPIPLGDVETTFFITALEKRLSGTENLKAVVGIADEYWRKALTISEQIRQVRRLHSTDVTPAEDHAEGLVVKANVLIPEIRSKIRIVLSLDADLEVAGGAKVVYGGVNEGVVSGFVEGGVKTGPWRGVVEEVVGRCLDGRRKGGVGVPTKQ
ncbi:Spc7-domain-containing protein [Choiromyces venosus 120613-1]|uniref:Spc7-domain-containing protein n=1 Tax=Choiromyces venosus 120613-1 TaxID=1336337 RepID=A0A3N4J7A8_9PEZI|nr:Spc7-domain-containing protein [Choiromyces venosus 120613-1]